MRTVLVLYNIRSNHNVGSIFRTADAAGVEKICLVGYTPAPVDRFGREVGEITKTALGAQKNVQWEKKENITDVIQGLKEEGYEVVALEQSDDSIDYRTFKPKEKLAIVVGNEVDGVPHETLALCDRVLEIPMMGEKESLNVAVATGILLFSIL